MRPDLYAYLTTSPLLWITVTMAVFLAGDWLFRKSGNHLLLNPIVTSVAVLVALLAATGTSYQSYFAGAQFIHFLLGSAIVALAVPLYRQIDNVCRSFSAIAVTLVVGSVVAAASGAAVAWLLGGSPTVLLSIAPKSVTVPIALGISEKIGGIPPLTVVVELLTGIVGNMIGAKVLTLCRVANPTARGFALGMAAHGNGTARAMLESPQSGAFSGLAMVLNGLVTALILPALVALLT